MSIHVSRFTKIYSRLPRPDLAHSFPRHVFLREPNFSSILSHQSGQLLVKHENILDSTFLHLTESFNDSELYLLGTTNYSDLLATRTKRLIEDVKPDVVFVQTEENWWRGAQFLGHVKSQNEMDLAAKELDEILKEKYPNNLRMLAFKLRFSVFALISKLFFGLPLDYNPFSPGLEVKYALEEASKLNSRVVFMGSEFDHTTMERFYNENRYTLLKFLKNLLSLSFNSSFAYDVEIEEYTNQLNNYGLRKFLESSCDQYFVNWIIQLMAKVFPDAKRIMIDKKEEDIFKFIMENKGKKMVCLVNQIHMEGVEHHWCHTYGQVPRNVRNINIDPIGDMPLRKMLFSQMYHVIMRDIKSSRFHSSPASFSNDIRPYWRENNFQYEHRNM